MDSEYTNNLAFLRSVVGALGESTEPPWWRSSFYSSNSEAFLAPLFPRTQTLARVCAVTEAAGSTHDEHVGIGDVHHLFRLPESLEQRIATVLHDPELASRIAEATADSSDPRRALESLAPKPMDVKAGPHMLGSVRLLDDSESVSLLASCYLGALECDVCVYPYLGEK